MTQETVITHVPFNPRASLMKGKSLKYGSFILTYSDTLNSVFVGYIQLYFIDIYSLYIVLDFLWIISFKHIINFGHICSSSPLLKPSPAYYSSPFFSLPFVFMPNLFTHRCICDIRAHTEFYACINKLRITIKKKYNICLHVLDLCQYSHPHLHTFPQQMNLFFHTGI